MSPRKITASAALTALSFTWGPSAHALQPVLQRGYDAGVDGANLAEVTLNTANVSPSTFGLVFKLTVDDNVYAQPLYVPNLAIPGKGNHNVVFVATMNDSLYAFDADSGAQLWSVNFASSVGATPVPYARFAFAGNRNVVGNLGILSTPVIDPSTNILYLVAGTLENNTMVYRLHAVNIATGTEPLANVVITASHGGSTFLSTGVTQRVSLTLAGNQVVFAFGALEEEASNIGGYVGWVMAYNKGTLVQSGAFATVLTGTRGGGVWQSGRPPVVDGAGYVYVFVGNGYTAGYDGVSNFAESALKLNPAAGLALVDWFTPGIWSTMDAGDFDLTSSGPMLIPGTNLIVGGGKTGILYVLNTGNLGKETAHDTGAVQEFTITADEMRGGTVYWQRSAANGGPLLYDWGDEDSLKSYAFNGSRFVTTPSAVGGNSNQTWPGGILALSANGDTPGTGILWAAVTTSGDSENNPPTPGALYAFDANNVSTALWNSTTNPARDILGNFAKFVPPLVANGRVYVATQSKQVAVYGLLSNYTLSAASLAFGNQLTNVASAPRSVTVTNTGSIAMAITGITLSTTGSQPFSQTNNCGTSVAVGASCTINVVFNPAVVGSATAVLSINAGNGVATQTVALTGTGIVPTYTVSASSVAFGNQPVNVASAPQSVTVTNPGTAALSVTSISLSTTGSQPFSQTNTCGTSVAAGASCTINVVFDPAAAGAASGVLSINAGNGAATQTVALTGTGIVPTYTVSATSLAFGNQATNVASAPKSVTVTNTGTAALSVTSVTLSTPGAQPFSQTNTCGTSVAAGASCAINVLFDPAAAGSATAVLSINGGNGAGTQSVALSGTGIASTVILTAQPNSVTVGLPVVLNWTAPSGAACVASGGQMGDGWTGTIPSDGTMSVTTSSIGTIAFTITCTSGAASVNAVAKVTATSGTLTGGGGSGGGRFDGFTLLWLATLVALGRRRSAHAE